MNANKLLTVVVVLQTVILLGQWTGTSFVERAHAQLPDAGNQRAEMVDELKTLNGKMDQLITILSDGNLQVRVATPDENAKQGK